MNQRSILRSRKFLRRNAQSLAEYAIILSLVAMVAVLLLRNIGVSTNNSMSPVNNTLGQ